MAQSFVPTITTMPEATTSTPLENETNPINATTPVAVQHVQVVAPSNLPDGYIFHAHYNGVTFPATVPQGGVLQNQTFLVPYPPTETSPLVSTPSVSTPLESISPIHHWKDDICACTRYGIFHPTFVNALCFPLALMGQIMTRLHLDWLAHPIPTHPQPVTSGKPWKTQPFQFMVFLTIVYGVIQLSSFASTPNVFLSVVNVLYGGYSMYIVWKVRSYVRQKYRIQEKHCVGYEDLCCAVWCSCCTVSQLARQTTDYELEEGMFCTNTGISVC